MQRKSRELQLVGAIVLTVIVTVTIMHMTGIHSATIQQPQAQSQSAADTLHSVGQSLRRRHVPTGTFTYSMDFTWSIFITPQGFVGLPSRLQRRAIESWIRLEPRPRIVLLGQGAGYEEVAKEYGLEINPHLDMNFIMMPLAGSVIDTAMQADTDISVVLNSDIILTQSFATSLAKLQSQFSDWFLAGARYDIQELPPQFEPADSDFDEAAFVKYVRTTGTLHTAGGQDYFAWNNNGGKLFHGIMPPFIRGKSKFDNWIVHEVIQAGYRDVIDGTDAVTAVHVVHNYVSAAGKVSKVQGGGGTFWMSAKTSDWQIFHNMQLAIEYGSYRNQDGTTVHAPWKLVSCLEPQGICLTKRLRPGVCPCEHNAFALKTQTDPVISEVLENDIRKNVVKCGTVSTDTPDAYKIPVLTPPGATPVLGLPFTMQQLLPMVAVNNHVLLSGVSYDYRDVVMSFVCNLRRLGIYDQLILAAFDEEMYRFGFKMGLPIFYYQTDLQYRNARDMAYGSDGFKQVTKLKSKVVLEILKLGYDVTWTDTDIVWFDNPLPKMQKMESDFVVQSNAPYPEEALPNGPLRINSGFYRVRSTPLTIDAMEKIVSHAAASSMTEQPSFYIILCGGREGTTVVGDNKCHYRSETLKASNSPGSEHPAKSVLEVEFLNRKHYPNGHVSQFWEQDDIQAFNPDIVILHNNWIKGLRAKIERLIQHGLWFYDRSKQVCTYEPSPRFVLDWEVADHGE
eukprot:m.292234 g.292234  ORF g.292234 m.292234 type:complete len:734 (-) comp15837_c0_seq5:572-2773(-)